MTEKHYLSDKDIAAIRKYLINSGTPLLNICYDLKISYPTLDSVINKQHSARKTTIGKIKNYFADKGVELEADIGD